MLFLSHRIPYPPTKGDKIRAWHFFEHLARRFTMHLGCFIDDPADWEHVPFLTGMCASHSIKALEKRRQRLRALARFRPGRPLTLDYFHDAQLQQWVDATLAGGRISKIFVFSSGMADYVMGDGRSDLPPAGRILDMVDIDSEKFAEYATRTRWPARLVWAREGRMLLSFERRAAREFDRTLFVSSAECARFGALAPETRDRIDWIENGVDLEHFAPGVPFADPFPSGRLRIVFTGTMDYWPNVDAMVWFVHEVMPLIRERVPTAYLTIVGANPGADVMSLASADVSVTGRVDDVRPYIAHAGVIVAPLRIARGIQNKVLEAMAMARPVVASPQALEGVRAQPGRDLLVAEGAEAMARCVAEVLAGEHMELGAAGRAAAEHGYRWSVALDKLDALVDEGAENSMLDRTGGNA